MTDDKDVDELLIMWKTVGELKLNVEKTLFGAYFFRNFQQCVGIMWKKLLYV
jgi:hypothetical protein